MSSTIIPCDKHMMHDPNCWECRDITELAMFFARGWLTLEQHSRALAQHPLLFKRARELALELYAERPKSVKELWELCNEVWLALDSAYQKHPADLVLLAFRTPMHACEDALEIIRRASEKDPSLAESRRLVKRAHNLLKSGAHIPNGPFQLGLDEVH